MYTYTTTKPTSYISSSITSSKGGYSQPRYRSRHIFLVVKQWSFALETWVMTPRMDRALGIFHNRADQCFTTRNMWRLRYGGWEYPPLEEVMEEEI